jgi:hypothetical protein
MKNSVKFLNIVPTMTALFNYIDFYLPCPTRSFEHSKLRRIVKHTQWTKVSRYQTLSVQSQGLGFNGVKCFNKF